MTTSNADGVLQARMRAKGRPATGKGSSVPPKEAMVGPRSSTLQTTPVYARRLTVVGGVYDYGLIRKPGAFNRIENIADESVDAFA